MLEFKNCINKKEIVAYVKEIGDELNNKIKTILSIFICNTIKISPPIIKGALTTTHLPSIQFFQ